MYTNPNLQSMKKYLLAILILIIYTAIGLYAYISMSHLSFSARIEVNNHFIPLALLLLLIIGLSSIVYFGIVQKIYLIKLKNNELLNETETEKVVEGSLETVDQDKPKNICEDLIAKMQPIISSKNSKEDLLEQLLWMLCDQYDISQAMVYLPSADNESLTLASTFAYRKDKDTLVKVLPGEGITGEVYAEKLPMLIKNIPSDYIKISSGLGQALPAMLYIYPCVNDDKVIALFELSTFSKWDTHTIHEIEKSCNYIVSKLN
jgi:hypothetical protein